MLAQMNSTDRIYRWGKREIESVRNNTSLNLFHSYFRGKILSIALLHNVNCACANMSLPGATTCLVTVVVLRAGVKCDINKSGFLLFQYIITL